MSSKIVALVAAAAGVASLATASVARANPVPLPFTYIYDTLPKGEGEVEQYVDYVPIQAVSPSGSAVWYGATQFQTEYEYGLTDHLELGLYVTFAPGPTVPVTDPSVLTEGNGAKERLRLRLFDAGVLPVDVGLYGELVENDRELELEMKIILERRFGALRVAANLWAEREYEFASQTFDWVLNPTLGASYQLSPLLHLGVEGFMRGEWPDSNPPRVFSLGPHEYAGPTMMLEFGKIWWSTGVYARVDHVGELPNPALPNDYGPVWMRTIVGITL
jgi:hypothetical protein